MVPLFTPALDINTYTNLKKNPATSGPRNHSLQQKTCKCQYLGKRKVPLSFCIQGLSKFLSCDCLRANKSHLFDSQAVQIHRPILCNYLHLFAHQKV